MHQSRTKCPELPHSILTPPWIFQVGQILCLVLRGEAEPGTVAHSNAEGITLGVLGPWLGCMNPKHTGGSSGGSQGLRGSIGKRGCTPHGSRTVLPQGILRHRMSLPAGGQGAMDALGVTTLCCCWERDKHCFGSTLGVRKGEQAHPQGTGGLSLEEGAVLVRVLPQLLCGVAPGSRGSVGQQCHPALPEPLLLFSRGAEEAPAQQEQGEAWGPMAGPTGNILHWSRDEPRAALPQAVLLPISLAQPRGGSCPA